MHGTATKLKDSRKISVNGAVKGEANFDGSNNITINVSQDNIAVVSGSINISASDAQGSYNEIGDGTVAYPSGFTQNNCKILSVSTALPAQGVYSTGNTPKFVATDVQKGIVPFYATRAKNNITVRAYNAMNQALTINYEIVLMKI